MVSLDAENQDSTFKKRPLERVFHSAAARIVDFFLLNDEFDYSEGDIAKRTKLSAKTVSREIPILVEEGIVKFTRKSGRSDMYKLNQESERVRGLKLYQTEVLDTRFEQFGSSAKKNIANPVEDDQTAFQ